MLRFTSSIRNSLSSGNWYSALMMALALPDICGRLETPNIGSKERSIRWLKERFEPLYTHQIGPKRETHTFLSANDFYALRCSLLHEGSDIIEEQRAREVLTRFNFITPPINGKIHCNQINNALQLQIDIFCNEIADTVEQWANDKSSDSEVQTRIKNLMVIHDSSKGFSF